MAASRFPDPPTSVELSESEFRHVFVRSIACVKQGTAPGRLGYPRGVAIDPATCHVYVAEGGKDFFARVSVFSELGVYLNSYTHPYMTSLWGIGIFGNNLYVTDTEMHAVFHFKTDAGFLLEGKLEGRGSGVGEFDGPCQLSTSTNGDVYIADRDNDRIQVLDGSLHPIREIVHPSMHRPRDVKLTADKIYVLSSGDSHCIHEFTQAGHKVRSLITRGKGTASVAKAYFFCISANESFIISDFSGHQIKIFSKEAALLHTLGKRGQEAGKFFCPCGLALTSNMRLVTVSWVYNFVLQIFSPF